MRTLAKSAKLFYGVILKNKITKTLNLLHSQNLHALKICIYTVAFVVFQALFAITQLLCHVSALLTRPVNKHNYYVSYCNILCAC